MHIDLVAFDCLALAVHRIYDFGLEVLWDMSVQEAVWAAAHGVPLLMMAKAAGMRARTARNFMVAGSFGVLLDVYVSCANIRAIESE